MSDSLSFLEIAEKALAETREPMTVTEIWNFAQKKKLKTNSVGKTPLNSLSSAIYVDIKNNPRTILKQISKGPSRFALTEWGEFFSDQTFKLQSIHLEDDNTPQKERELHPNLAAFVYSNLQFKAYVKTIYHEVSLKAKRGANRWLHPDIVGVRFAFEEYEPETLALQKLMGAADCILYSFEMKVNLHFGNLREAYFQAVSNSSWANEGYLVAAYIEEESDFWDELNRLNNAFGIGVILLDLENPENGQIIVAARPKAELDIGTVDRLAYSNKNFKEFIRNIAEDIKVGKVKSEYDKRN
ncbi:hypothetical protein EHO58_10090 [Leptospira selangorensis]|uniref:HTH domain-containing protein n=1 Tax=Leptospira selangorensis TaxID=2484982 RepID=UPI0010834F58|nr:HTH domain-containing protein [Leptospira selangorensis]TGK06094.1 hypothetical protein EHO58_10090 [Leptospira selangorensis]